MEELINGLSNYLYMPDINFAQEEKAMKILLLCILLCVFADVVIAIINEFNDRRR